MVAVGELCLHDNVSKSLHSLASGGRGGVQGGLEPYPQARCFQTYQVTVASPTPCGLSCEVECREVLSRWLVENADTWRRGMCRCQDLTSVRAREWSEVKVKAGGNPERSSGRASETTDILFICRYILPILPSVQPLKLVPSYRDI